MSAPLGFILLTHDKPHQSRRLVNRLNAMFDFPPITCHHDFLKCAIPDNHYSPNVTFVRPHVKTYRADFTLVEATMSAMEKMFLVQNPPERFVVLSGADHPIKPARQILADLQEGNYDAHITYELVQRDQLVTPRQKLAFRRYHCYNFPPPWLHQLLKRQWPMLTRDYPRWLRGLLPFSKNLECYVGDQWFSANRRAAEYLIEFYRTDRRLANYCRKILFSDEFYFQTVLANAPKFRLNNNNWRYTDWSEGTSHPKTLGVEDLTRLQASTAHFARKFDLDMGTDIYDRIDEMTA